MAKTRADVHGEIVNGGVGGSGTGRLGYDAGIRGAMTLAGPCAELVASRADADAAVLRPSRALRRRRCQDGRWASYAIS